MTATSFKIETVGNGVTVLRLARPEAANALTVPMVRELRAALASLASDGQTRVLVLAAEGKAFCAGLDLKEVILGDDAPEGPIESMALQEMFSGLMAEVARLPMPVIAAVNGAAVGAGMGLALAADLRIVAPAARFLVGAVRIGLSAGECGISYHLPRLIGAGPAFEIMLTGRAVGSEEAMRIGLASRASTADGLLSEALALAHEIAENSPYSTKHTKQVMRANLDAPSLEAALELENHVQCLALVTEDFKEACRAFTQKRAPNFTGR